MPDGTLNLVLLLCQQAAPGDSLTSELHWIPDWLPFLATALLVPVGMLVFDRVLRLYGGAADSTGAEFYLGNAAINLGAIPALQSFELQGFDEDKFLATLLVLAGINVVVAILAMMVQTRVDARAVWQRISAMNVRPPGALPRRPTIRRALLWIGLIFLLGLNIVLFLYVFPSQGLVKS